MTTGMMKKTSAEYFKTQPVLKAWLFGSYSRGEQTKDSDVDIIVLLDKSNPIGLKLFFSFFNFMDFFLYVSYILIYTYFLLLVVFTSPFISP